MNNPEKKCSSCEQWVADDGTLEAICSHCGVALRSEEKFSETRKRRLEHKRRVKFEDRYPFHVRPGDNFAMKWIKQGGHYLYLAFLALMSFITWVVFWLAS